MIEVIYRGPFTGLVRSTHLEPSYFWRQTTDAVFGHVEFQKVLQVSYGGRHALKAVVVQPQNFEAAEPSYVLWQCDEKVVGHV
jgi:hypothetical protein